MKGKKFYIIISVAIAVIVLASIFIKKSSSPVTADHSTIRAENRTIYNKTHASGTITPNIEVEIKSQLSGIVENIYVKTGDKVKKGDKLAKITVVPDPSSLNSAESSVNISKINLAEAEKQYKRQARLYNAGIITEADYNTASSNYERSKQEFETAKNTLQLLKEGVANKVSETANIIYATTNGTVLSINAKRGASVIGRSSFQEGSIILVIADMRHMIFRGTIGEAEVDKLKIGMLLDLKIAAFENETFKAELGFIAPKGQKDANGSAVRFDINALVLPKEGYNIRAGYSANAEIILDQRDSVLSLPEKNIIYINDSAFVEILKDDKSFKKQPIKLGISDGIHTEILSGITLSDRVKVQKGNLFTPVAF